MERGASAPQTTIIYVETMANKVDFAVSVTPLFTHVRGEGQANTNSIASDIGKRLGGSGSVAAPAYAGTLLSNINVSTATSLVGASSGTKLVFIRHRGVNELGVSTASTLTVLIAGAAVAILNSGEAWFIPNLGAAAAAAAVTGTSSSGQISVEVADID